jgi:hypothetical protein
MLGLAGFQALDAVACAIPNRFITQDLDRLGFPADLRPVLPIIKGASAVGLIVGVKRPRLGALTAAALVAYFVAALGAHARVRDGAPRFAPAVGMLVWAAAALRLYRSSPT